MQQSSYQAYVAFLEKQAQQQQRRVLPFECKTQSDALTQVDKVDATLLDFSSNDYLGLSCHPDVVAAAQASALVYGVGSTGARLLSGDSALFHEFEAQIARDKGTAAALIFSSGFQANSSVLAALLDTHVLGQTPLVFTDKLNHASLHQACQLAGVKQIRFQHNNMDHLRIRLMPYYDDPRPKWIVTESVFGMDGDCVPMAELIALSDEFNAQLFIDEAHATGVFGATGHGLCQHQMQRAEHSRGIVMGTFSKALGGAGAYVACSHVVRDYLINRCAGFMYSTAPSPMVVASMLTAWRLLPSMASQRAALLEKAAMLRETLRVQGFDTGVSTSQIVPVMLGSEANVLSAQAYLAAQGMIVSAIRSPTVPEHAARLRIALTVNHDVLACERLVAGLCAWRDKVGYHK